MIRVGNFALKYFNKLNEYIVEKPCLKQSVKALIVTKDEDYIFGSNSINNIVQVCPRVEKGCETGEGYELCKNVCNQNSHAEVSAILEAKGKNISIKGASLFLVNHSYCCKDCIKQMSKAEISKVYVLSEIGQVTQTYELNIEG